MARYRYLSCHPVTRAQLSSSLPLIDPEWSWVVGGNGTLSAKITVPEDQRLIDRLRTATQPEQAAIYVRDAEHQYPWGGPVIKRTWNRKANQITIACMEWRAWLYQIIYGPASLTTDNFTVFTAVDQLQMARDLVSVATAGGTADGCPVITYDATMSSGKLRDLSFWGTEMRKVGALVDTVANRDGGFEWSLECLPHPTDGLPALHFASYYPQRGGQVPGLVFRATPEGRGNVIPGDYEEDYGDWVDRVWTTGAGQPPDQAYAFDKTPPGTNALRADAALSFSTVTERITLASHARSARRFFQPGTNLTKVIVPFNVNPESYHIGDRVRYRVKDRWLDVDLPSVRIVEKKVSMAGAGKVDVTLDLTDFMLPDVDTAGAV